MPTQPMTRKQRVAQTHDEWEASQAKKAEVGPAPKTNFALPLRANEVSMCVAALKQWPCKPEFEARRNTLVEKMENAFSRCLRENGR